MFVVATVLDRENDVDVSEAWVGVEGCDEDMFACLFQYIETGVLFGHRRIVNPIAFIETYHICEEMS